MLALLGWLAQFCLPLAHASVMAERGLGVAAGCGKCSPALEARLAERPAEIREILKGSLTHGEHASETCADLCVTPASGAAPSLPPTVALRAAGVEGPAIERAAAPPRSPIPGTPPVRGPPART